MKFLNLDDSISRFRFTQSCVGLTGCLCVSYAVWTPYWLKGKGLWAEWNRTESDLTSEHVTVDNGELNSFNDFGTNTLLYNPVTVSWGEGVID